MLQARTEAGVLRLTLDRPEKRNALSLELRRELAAALTEPDANCVLLTGAGSAFCAGMDTSQFGGDADHRRAIVETSEALFDALVRCPVPLVAAVNGPALGGGFALALLCDVRIAGRAGRFGFPEVARGIPAAYGAARAALPPAVARDLCLTGRTIEADEALRLGVVSQVVEDAALSSRAAATAQSIAAHPPLATRTLRAWMLEEAERSWALLLESERAALRSALL